MKRLYRFAPALILCAVSFGQIQRVVPELHPKAYAAVSQQLLSVIAVEGRNASTAVAAKQQKNTGHTHVMVACRTIWSE